MAKKKFLNENNEQIWPITRIDCIYTMDGSKLLPDALDEEFDSLSAKIEEIKTNMPEIPSIEGLASKEFVTNSIAELREEMVILEEDDLTIDGLVDGSFPSLTTEDKTLIGAINEINENIQNIKPSEEEIKKAVIDEILMDVFGITVEDGE